MFCSRTETSPGFLEIVALQLEVFTIGKAINLKRVILEMKKSLVLMLWFALLCFSTQSRPITAKESEPPLVDESFKPSTSQNEAGACSYTVSVKTSCSSVSYTRDQISLAFGDANGNQVFMPRIDDPLTRTFERCSTDTFQVHGPCTYQICYVYLYRSGRDGWVPATVTVSGGYSTAVVFNYDSFVPGDVWFGFNRCGVVAI